MVVSTCDDLYFLPVPLQDGRIVRVPVRAFLGPVVSLPPEVEAEWEVWSDGILRRKGWYGPTEPLES